ncbi:MAG: hypothetical protein RIM99_18140 [Cyclobacteriaceae bacterium]
MEDDEFDVLDELYFVISYSELQDRLDLGEERLREVLIRLYEKGWVRIYESMEVEAEEADLNNKFKFYFYLASKKGLMAHNRQ